MPENFIICVKKNTIKQDNELFPGYSVEESPYTEKKYCCWNCTYSLDNHNSKNIPIKYNQGVFYVNGYFCSTECSLRYLCDNYTDKDLWSKYELFKYYCKIIYGKDIDIVIPPNKLFLQKFGGDLTIEEYRTIDNYNEINNPPIIIINNNNVNKIDKKINNDYLKLYRKKKKETNTIFNNMDIN